MRYSILDFDQEILLKFNAKHPDSILDITDLFILDYIAQAQSRPDFEHITVEKDELNTAFAHIERNVLLEDLPILRIKESMLTKRFSKLLNHKLIELKKVANDSNRGSKSFYRITKRASALKSSEFSLEELDDDEEYTTRRKKLRMVSQRPDVKNYVSVNRSYYTNMDSNITNTLNNKTQALNKNNSIKEIKVITNKYRKGKNLIVPKEYEVLEDMARKLGEIYNEICTNLPNVKKINDTRLDLISSLIREYKKNDMDVEDLINDFTKACTIANNTPFLLGETGGTWKANFEFLISKSKNEKKKDMFNIDLVLEGSYGNDKKYKPKSIKDLPCNRNVKSVAVDKEEEAEVKRILKERGGRIVY